MPTLVTSYPAGRPLPVRRAAHPPGARKDQHGQPREKREGRGGPDGAAAFSPRRRRAGRQPDHPPSQQDPTLRLMTYTSEPPTLFHPHVEVRVSKRRKKTAGAHWEGDRIVVVVPAHLRGAERDEMVDALARRLASHRPHLHASDDRARAAGPRPRSALPRRCGPRLHPMVHHPGQALGLVHPRHSARSASRSGSGSSPTGYSTRSSSTSWPISSNRPTRPGSTQLEQRYPRRDEADIFLEGYALGLHMPGAGDDPLDEGCAARAEGAGQLITT